MLEGLISAPSPARCRSTFQGCRHPLDTRSQGKESASRKAAVRRSNVLLVLHGERSSAREIGKDVVQVLERCVCGHPSRPRKIWVGEERSLILKFAPHPPSLRPRWCTTATDEARTTPSPLGACLGCGERLSNDESPKNSSSCRMVKLAQPFETSKNLSHHSWIPPESRQQRPQRKAPVSETLPLEPAKFQTSQKRVLAGYVCGLSAGLSRVRAIGFTRLLLRGRHLTATLT